MPEPWHSRDAAAGALRVDRVEWLAATTQELLVLVHGRWHGPEAPGRPTLLVRGGERVLRVDAREILDAAGTSLIGGELPSADAPWTARFPVAMEHRPRLAAGLALLLGGSEHTLPRAVRVPAHAAGTGEAPAAQVIDRAVLAERRARRAEMVEGTLEQRAEEAEATVRDLEWRLESVEEQLAAVVREREQLRERVTGAEREVRRIRQREYAEQQLRIEAETRADAGDLELHSKIEALRRRLQDSEAEGERLREDLEDTRRELAGAQLRAGAERVALNRAREAVVGEDEMRARIDAAVAAQGEVAALRRDLEERHGALTERIAEMTERAGRLEQQLATQRSRTEVAERDRDRLAQAEGGSAARIAELEQRAAVAGHVRAELRALHEELERVRRGSEAQAERNVAAERTLIELHETLGGLRSELDRLERGKAQAQAQARRLGEELSASREALHELSRRGQADAADLARVTRESATQRAQLADADAAAEAARRSAVELQELLERERAEHSRVDAALREELVGEQARQGALARRDLEQELERRLAELLEGAGGVRERHEHWTRAPQRQFEERLNAQREGYAAELSEMESRVQQLEGELGDALEELRRQLGSERQARQAAERALAREGAVLAHERAALARLTEQLEPPETDPVDDAAEVSARPRTPGLRLVPAGGDLRDAVTRLRERIAELERSEGGADGADAEGAGAEGAGAEGAEAAVEPDPPDEPSAVEHSEPFAPLQPGPPGGLRAVPDGAQPLSPRVLADGQRRTRTPWLAQAIRRLADGGQAAQAGALILDLLPAQGLVISRSLTYGLDIQGLGRYRVALTDGRADLAPAQEGDTPPELALAGPAGAFAELAAGGTRRRLPDVAVTGGRRRLRPLLKARRRPVSLADLYATGRPLRAEPMLHALAVTIEPRWTAGHRFSVGLQVLGEPQALLAVFVEDGRPVRVAEEWPAEGCTVTVRLGERACLALFSGSEPPVGEELLVDGDETALKALVSWTDRGQGLG